MCAVIGVPNGEKWSSKDYNTSTMGPTRRNFNVLSGILAFINKTYRKLIIAVKWCISLSHSLPITKHPRSIAPLRTWHSWLCQLMFWIIALAGEFGKAECYNSPNYISFCGFTSELEATKNFCTLLQWWENLWILICFCGDKIC